MWILGGAQREIGTKILEQYFLILVLADGGANSLVNGHLILFLLFRWYITFLLDSKDIAFTAVFRFLFLALEVDIVDVGWNFHRCQIDAGLGGNDIPLGNATQWA